MQLKKLSEPWSAQLFHMRSPEDVDNARMRFTRCDKKMKMRILLSIMVMESNIRGTLLASLKQLLKEASEDKDEWVQIIAGIVHGRVFPAVSDIQDKYNKVLHESASRVVQHLRDQVIFDDKDVYEYFEPLQECFLTSAVTEDHNSHFQYQGASSGPNFILREKKYLEEKLAEEKKKVSHTTLMHPNTSSLTSNSRRSVSSGQSTLKGISSGGSIARKGIKSISLSQIQEKKNKEKEAKEKEAKEKEAREKEAKEKEAKEKKEKLKSKESISSSSKQEKEDKKRKLDELHESSATKTSSLDETQSSEEKCGGVSPRREKAPKITDQSSSSQHVNKILDEIRHSSLVSDDDKKYVENFFHDKESQVNKNNTDASSQPEVRKIKFKEEEKADKNGDTKIVRVILELTIDGSNYSYRKIQKTIKPKSKCTNK